MKHLKKSTTNNTSIAVAENKLGIKYPEELRKRLKKNNGFEWGGFRFYPVLDNGDKEHTFDDVVRENTNDVAGWKNHIPEGYVCIASSDLECLLLSKKKDGKIYLYISGYDEFETIFDNVENLAEMLDENDLLLKLDSPAENKYFIKLLLYSTVKGVQYVLLFHKQPKLTDPGQGLVYSSRVNKGERLTEVAKKEVTKITGTDKFELLRVINGGTDFDRQGNELKKYNLIIRVDHFDTKERRFSELNNAYMSWADTKEVLYSVNTKD